uniref:hypothetical protein n=1 Tax=Bacteroides nordii TaxID=291645 RepID=UPI0034A46F75
RIWLNSPQYQTLTLFIQILPFFCEFFVYLFIADDCVVVFLPVSYDGHCLFPMVIEGIRGIIVKLGDDYML